MHYRKAAPKQARRFDRLSFLGIVVFLFAAGLCARLFTLQVLRHSFYSALAEERETLSQRLTPTRGQVFFRDGANPSDLLPLAVNRTMRLVYANPKHVQDPETVVERLEKIVPLNHDETLAKLKRSNDQYEPLLHNVPKEIADKISLLNLTGIATTPETDRFYPFADITSQITGFVGYQGDARKGQYGIEGYWDEQLSGAAGKLGGKDGNDASSATLTEARNGDSLILTIDRTVQHTVCFKLNDAVQKHGAEGGSVIVVKPDTGAIIALCNAPSFDANHYADAGDISVYTDSAITDQFEPGSVMKTITLSAALDQGLITPDTTYTDEGSVKIGKYTIQNSEHKTYGAQTMSGVLEQSINTGAIFVAQKLGLEKFRDYVSRFGFGEKTGVELQGESAGNTSALDKKGDIYLATSSFGQGVTATPLQLVMAYAAIANDGKLMKPYIVDERLGSNDYREKTEPTVVRQVISPAAARMMQSMLVNVVRKGHGKRADVAGFYVGGKTGTAQVPLKDRAGYDPNRHIGTFVGMAPITKPEFVMVAKIIDPKDVQFAESSAAPLFGDIASFLLKYYRVVPDDQEASK